MKKNIVKNTLSDLSAIPLGYSCAGVVVAKSPEISNLKIGDRVACAGAGKAVHAEYVSVPRNLIVKLPKEVCFEDAAFTTVGSIALQGVRQGSVSLGEKVVVVGLGLIGQLAVQLLLAAGCEVIALDIQPARVLLAKKSGAQHAFSKNFVDNVLKTTGGYGADCILICAASSAESIVQDSIKMCRKKGRVVVVGDIPMNLPRSPFYEKEIDFTISCSYGPGRYDPDYEEQGFDYPYAYVRWTENRNMGEFVRLIADKKIHPEYLLDQVFKIDDAENAYAAVMTGKPISVVLTYLPSKRQSKTTIKKTTVTKSKINIAVVGCGNFLRFTHIPNISKIPDFNIRAVVDRTGSKAKRVAEDCGAAYCSTDFNDILNDKDIDLIFITNTHNLHAKQSAMALAAGKHVFVEKPIALTPKECTMLENTDKKSKAFFTVGFNRRYAPLASDMKKHLASLSGPAIINYRVNAGVIPKENWVNIPTIGGGRIIGEACHFFDFFNWIIDSKPVSVNSHRMESDNICSFGQDNLICSVKYEDGSIANLIYTTLGSNKASKEFVEVFKSGSYTSLDDFKLLSIDGDVTKQKQDKGHFNELLELRNLLRKQNSKSIDFNQALIATKISFIAAGLLDKL